MTSTTKPMAPSIRQTFTGQGVRRISGPRLDSTAESVDSRCGSTGSTRDPPKRTNLTLSFSNIRGLRSNFTELTQFLSTESPDLLAVSETRLASDIQSSEVTVDGYVLHRLDKAPCHGLALFAKPSLPLVRLSEYEDCRFEFLPFVAHLEKSILLLFFLYRSPSATSEVFEVISDKIDSLLAKYPSAQVAVFGDFNVHNTEWLTFSRTTDSNS